MFFPLLLATLLLVGAAGAASAQAPAPSFADAVQMADAGRDAEAFAAFRELAARDPDDRRARLWIARLHERMGHPDLAEPVYRSVLLEEPSNLEAMLGVASILLAREETDEAIDILEDIAEREPQNATALSLLGRAHQQGGRPTLAMMYFERAAGVAATQENVIRLDDARGSYLHRFEARLFGESFSGSTPASQSGDFAVNYRVSDSLRVLGRGQAQRKFSESEGRGGAGVEWRWRPAITLRGHAIIGPGNRVMPEGDYLGEVEYTRRFATWSAAIRSFDFTGARTGVFAPAVSWLPRDDVALSLRYAATWTETISGNETGHSLQLRGARRLSRRLWLEAGYAAGVEDFENFSIDRIGDFRANTASGGLRIDLARLLTMVGSYEHQWRSGGSEMRRGTVAINRRF